jgi:PAS domain S-box-containing protein
VQPAKLTTLFAFGIVAWLALKGSAMPSLHFLRDLRVRSKLLLSFLAVFILTVPLAGFTIYSLLRETLEANIESELKNSTAAILSMVRTSVSVSIKNHLRAAAEKNLEMVNHVYSRYTSGIISESEAKALAAALLLSQRIGTTGYIACVDSRGTMVVHPKESWVGVDISDYTFVQEMIRRKEGYIEQYDWQNPGEKQAQPKALYMTYFEPWDWIINVSSYRREFSQLVNVDDFREAVTALQFGKTGYAFVTDVTGRIIIHPQLEGIDLLNQTDLPNEPMRTMVAQKSGKIEYLWQNPGDPRVRKKLVLFNHLPEVDWIVACSSYMDEIYAPLKTLANVIIFAVFASFLLMLVLSFLVSGSITNPLQDLIKHIEKASRGDFSIRMTRRAHDEVGFLADYFNNFMDRLEQYSRSLQTEIEERRQAEEALRVSEEKYRSVMEAAPDPIIVYDMEGRVTYFNSAFKEVFGWELAECLGRKMDHFVPSENWPETRRGLDVIAAGHHLSSIETRRRTKTGQTIDTSIRGAVYRDRNGRPVGSVIIHRDITDLKRLEKALIDTSDRERQMIGSDLHDDLCPHLIGIEGLIKVLKSRLMAKAYPEHGLAEQIEGLIKEATLKARHLTQGLCPVNLIEHGLTAALQELAIRTKTRFNVRCDIEWCEGIDLKDSNAATHLFYIAQEAVHNAVRHGHPKRIQITLEREGEFLHLSVSDDGCGLREDRVGKGMGLRFMAFRAKMIDASLEIETPLAGGTRVSLHRRLELDGVGGGPKTTPIRLLSGQIGV